MVCYIVSTADPSRTVLWPSAFRDEISFSYSRCWNFLHSTQRGLCGNANVKMSWTTHCSNFTLQTPEYRVPCNIRLSLCINGAGNCLENLLSVYVCMCCSPWRRLCVRGGGMAVCMCTTILLLTLILDKVLIRCTRAAQRIFNSHFLSVAGHFWINDSAHIISPYPAAMFAPVQSFNYVLSICLLIYLSRLKCFLLLLPSSSAISLDKNEQPNQWQRVQSK